MKKLITLLSLVLFTSYTAKASHAMGGEITVNVDASNVAHITLAIYRDANSGTASLPNSQNITIESLSTTNPAILVSLSRVSINTLPSQYATQRHVYTGTVQLPSNGDYKAQWTLCCRNAAIVNSTDPSSESLHLKPNLHLSQVCKMVLPYF